LLAVRSDPFSCLNFVFQDKKKYQLKTNHLSFGKTKVYIGFGAIYMISVGLGLRTAEIGVIRLLSGLTFPVPINLFPLTLEHLNLNAIFSKLSLHPKKKLGLLLIIFMGGELFPINIAFYVVGLLQRTLTFSVLIYALVVSVLGNTLGLFLSSN
jgi:formate/nitrite transporter FocA (FNT family)